MSEHLTVTDPLSLPADPDPGAFATATAVTPTGDPGRFAAELHPEWSVAGRPNGGYLVSVLGRAATAAAASARPAVGAGLSTTAAAASGAGPVRAATPALAPSTPAPAPSILAASTHFLRPPAPGPVELVVEPLHLGRSTSQVRARLTQAGRPCVEAMLTIGELRAGVPATWTGVGPQPGAAPWAECIPLRPDSAVFPVPLLDHVDLRLSPATSGWTQGRPTGRGELTGWLALPGGAAFDPISLLFAVDAFPPATFDVQMSGWVPTFQLSTYVRAMPAPGPVQVLHRAQAIADGRVDETCLIWDQAGTLVAQSTQLAGIRLG